MTRLQKQDLIYPELSYQIIGILFDVFNELGPGFQEKYYQRAVVVRLRQVGLRFSQQISVKMLYRNQNIGHYILDFLIDRKVIVELKRGNRFLKRDIDQVYAYLKATKLQLGIIANFTSSGIKYKRILNLY
ncbi:MAG: GxxExxY protein [Patescibacteria group bacterium]